MIIEPTQTFLHGKTRFLPANRYRVPDPLGGFFLMNGWARLVTEDAPDAITVDGESLDPNARPAPKGGVAVIQAK